MTHHENSSTLKQQERLNFIEYRLYWDGEISRNDLIEKFQISPAQATLDLKSYQEAAPKNIEYSVTSKRYIPKRSFKPKFIAPDAAEYLSSLLKAPTTRNSEKDSFSPTTEALPIFIRRIEPSTLQAVVQAMKQSSVIKLDYQSPFRPATGLRRVYPLAFVFVLGRWHLRAYCFERKDFRSFVLGRIIKVHDVGELTESLPPDMHWAEIVEILIKPSKSLTNENRTIIEQDYHMTNGLAKISVRRALLKYFLFENKFSKGSLSEPSHELDLVEDNEVIALENPIQIKAELKILSDTRRE
ncbi:WYL domain-containing protein [Kiritimatiellota bacterium B12222]|nr:WYL domain-containing protein [Kiritimatiellota bacterium B12222]